MGSGRRCCKARQGLKNTQGCGGETRGREPSVTTRNREEPTGKTAELHWSPGPRRNTEAELMPKKYFISTPGTTAHLQWRAALLPDWLSHWCKVKAFHGELLPAGHMHAIPHSETLLTTIEMGSTSPFSVTQNAHKLFKPQSRKP